MILFRLGGFKVKGLHNLPPDGGVIIASNHVNFWDAVLVAIAAKRPVHFIGKAELFKNPLSSWFFYHLHAFPVKRGAPDRKAIRTAMDIVEQGNILGIFPEGTRQDSKAHTGVAMIALKTGIDVIPAACVGTQGKVLPWGWFKPLEVRIGPAVKMSDYQDRNVNSALLDTVSNDIMTKINGLLLK